MPPLCDVCALPTNHPHAWLVIVGGCPEGIVCNERFAICAECAEKPTTLHRLLRMASARRGRPGVG